MRRLLAVLALHAVLFFPAALAQEAGNAPDAHAPDAHAAAEHAEAHEEHAPMGGPNATMWKTINFVIMVGLAAYFLRGKVGPFFEGRNQEIAQGMSAAAAKEKEAQARLAGIEAQLAGLQTEIARLRESAQHEMERDRQRIQAETAAAIERLQEHAAAEIASASATARNDLRRHAAALALNLAEERIASEAKSPETRQRLLTQAIRKLGDGASRN